MKWEKCTFGELRAGDVFEFVHQFPNARNVAVERFAEKMDSPWLDVMVRGEVSQFPMDCGPNTPVYRLIPDVVDAKWVEKASGEISAFTADMNLSDQEALDGIAAIIRRHAPALDVSAIESKLEAIRDKNTGKYFNNPEVRRLATECLALIRGEK